MRRYNFVSVMTLLVLHTHPVQLLTESMISFPTYASLISPLFPSLGIYIADFVFLLCNYFPLDQCIIFRLSCGICVLTAVIYTYIYT